MKSLANLCAATLLTGIVAICTAPAQAQNPPVPLEIIACNFVDGSDGGDLQNPMDDLNEWLDERDFNDINITTLIPIFTSDAFTPDVLFLNRWVDGNAMGQNLGAFFSPDAGDVGEGFNNVVDCSSTTAFAAILLQAPGQARNGGPIQFMNCTVKENRTAGEAIGAINEWAQASREAGSENGAGHVVMFPIAGENLNASYNFKWVVLFQSFESYGASLQALLAPGGPNLGDTIDPVMDCDSARLYNQIVNRSIQDG